jgi:hypothetical protein
VLPDFPGHPESHARESGQIATPKRTVVWKNPALRFNEVSTAVHFGINL